MRKTLAVGIPLLSTAALLVACSAKKPSPPMTPTVTPDAGAYDAAVSDAAATDASAAAVDAGPTVVVGDAGVPDLGPQAFDSVIDLAIAAAAPKVAPKMEKEGQPGRATLKEGEHFSMMITLAPNRCYTIVGFSPPGSVSQLDLKLYGPPLFNVEAGKSGAGDKAMPVIGKGTTALCPILPIAVPYKVDAVATKGSGRMGIHVYGRNK